MNGLYVFTLRDIPVYISPWYALIAAFFGMQVGGAAGLIWVGALTLSLLVHEFGHGLVARHYGLNPQVLLHGWGGLCSHQPAERDKHDVFILIMGPGAGLILGLLVLIPYLMVDPAYLATRPLLGYFFTSMLYINIVWSFVNLIPLWPLDGGQLFNIGLKQKLSVVTTHKATHTIGLVLGAAAAVYGLTLGSFFLVILCGVLAYMNFSRLNSPPEVRGAVVRQPSAHANELYEDALAAMAEHDWQEAARLAHQMRDEHLSKGQLEQVWELLAVATTNLGDYEQALRYIDRAPDTAPVQEARKRCIKAMEEAVLH